MSALPPKADMLSAGIDVCFVPIADITEAAAGAGILQVVESWASNDCASKAQGERQGMKRAVSGFTRPPGQKPDALALMGCAGDWIVMPEATKLSVSMIVSFSAFSPHCKLSDLTNSLSALSI